MSEHATTDAAEDERELAELNPGTGRHATLTAASVAQDEHGRPVSRGEILEAAIGLDVLDDFAESTIRRRIRTLWLQMLLDREETDGRVYTVTDEGRNELDEHGPYEPTEELDTEEENDTEE